MRLIIPYTIADANLIATNILENDAPEWATGTTYTTGDVVMSLATHKRYEALQAVPADINPDTDTTEPPYWLELGATNRWKVFDKVIADKTTTAGTTITYTLGAFGKPASAVSVFGLNGETAQLVVTDATDGEVYNQTITLVDNGLVVNGYTYFFEPFRVRTEATFENIPPYADAEYALTVTGTLLDLPEIGEIVLGSEYTLGSTTYGTSVGIEDFSVKERDQFGRAFLVERPFAKLVDFDFVINTRESRRTATLLEEVRATPAVYFADRDTDQFGTTVYGFYRNFSINLNSPSISNVTLEVEGLT